LLKDFYSQILKYVINVDENTVYGIMHQMLNDIDKTSLIVDTRFAGTRSNANICGSITGVTTGNLTPPQLTLGILEGIALELFEMYKKMNVNRIGIVGSGNGVRKNAALVKTIEKTFGAKMIFPRHKEEASFGAALFGLISCGVFKSASEAQKMIQYL